MTGMKVTSSLAASDCQVEKTIAIRLFGVTDIPAAMRKVSCNISADLMQYWFDGGTLVDD